jgi:hypothetical protein
MTPDDILSMGVVGAAEVKILQDNGWLMDLGPVRIADGWFTVWRGPNESRRSVVLTDDMSRWPDDPTPVPSLQIELSLA